MLRLANERQQRDAAQHQNERKHRPHRRRLDRNRPFADFGAGARMLLRGSVKIACVPCCGQPIASAAHTARPNRQGPMARNREERVQSQFDP